MELHLDEGTGAATSRIRVEHEPDVLVVALAGEHDVSSSDRLREAVEGAFQAGLGVVVDLRDAAFVDSVVAAVFLESRKRAEQEDVGLAIVLAEEHDNPVRRMFELSRLTSVFAIYPSVEAAAEAVREPPSAA